MSNLDKDDLREKLKTSVNLIAGIDPDNELSVNQSVEHLVVLINAAYEKGKKDGQNE